MRNENPPAQGSRSAGPQIVSSGDREIVAAQLGRPPRDLHGIAARCPFGYPAVIETAPVMAGGAPNPTLLYLTCPVLTVAVSEAESRGAVRAFKEWIGEDDEARLALGRITEMYRERRTALAGDRAAGARLEAGIGGPEAPEKASCLHAYGAALLAITFGWPAGQPLGNASPFAETRRGSDRSEASSLALARSVKRIWEQFLPCMEKAWCTDARCGRSATGERRAAIDVGTISVRLLVAEVRGREVRQLVRRAQVTRLGEGLRGGGRLSEEAKLRTTAAVAAYAEEARTYGVDAIVLAGTSAAREAADGSEFIRKLGNENGLLAVVLSGREEAELAYTGATLDIAGEAVVVDVGGGSTELIRRSTEGTVDAVSVELGANRATEHWIRSDPPLPTEIENAYEEAARIVGRVRARFGTGPGASGASEGSPRLVGVAGTVTTLACLEAGLQTYDPDVLHLRTLAVNDVKALAARLGEMTVEERAALPCLQAGRAPVIVGGAVVLQAVMETLGYSELTVSERDLLDGLVLRGRAAAYLGKCATEEGSEGECPEGASPGRAKV